MEIRLAALSRQWIPWANEGSAATLTWTTRPFSGLGAGAIARCIKTDAGPGAPGMVQESHRQAPAAMKRIRDDFLARDTMGDNIGFNRRRGKIGCRRACGMGMTYHKLRVYIMISAAAKSILAYEGIRCVTARKEFL